MVTNPNKSKRTDAPSESSRTTVVFGQTRTMTTKLNPIPPMKSPCAGPSTVISVQTLWQSGPYREYRPRKRYPANLWKPLANGSMRRDQLCGSVGSVLRSLRNALFRRLFSPRDLFHRCTGRRDHHRLQAAAGCLGSKPVACIGSFDGSLCGWKPQPHGGVPKDRGVFRNIDR